MVLSKPNKSEIYDEIRKIWVVATPEEIIRQKLLKKMLYRLSYPKELLVVEKVLSELPFLKGSSLPSRRVDIACFIKQANGVVAPLLLIECKQDSKDANEALEQVKGYNSYLKAPFIAIAHLEGEVLCFAKGGELYQIDYLPSYLDLAKALCHVHA
jgi:hypothetical protein